MAAETGAVDVAALADALDSGRHRATLMATSPCDTTIGLERPSLDEWRRRRW